MQHHEVAGFIPGLLNKPTLKMTSQLRAVLSKLHPALPETVNDLAFHHSSVVTDTASTTSWGETNQPTIDCQKGMPAVFLGGLSFKRQQVSSDCTHPELILLTEPPHHQLVRGSSSCWTHSWKRNPSIYICCRRSGG